MMNVRTYKQMAFDYELYLALEEMFAETSCMNEGMERKLREENNQVGTLERDRMTLAAQDARRQIEGEIPEDFKNGFASVYLLRNRTYKGKPCLETRVVFVSNEYMLEVAARPERFLTRREQEGESTRPGVWDKSCEKARVAMRLYRNLPLRTAA